MNKELTKKAKMILEKIFSKLMNNAVFKKAMGNVRNRRDIKLVTIKAKKNYFVSEPNNHTIFS